MGKWLAALFCAALSAHGQDSLSNSYLGKEPPELVSEKGWWINSTEPLKLRELKGKVVWLEFGVLG